MHQVTRNINNIRPVQKFTPDAAYYGLSVLCVNDNRNIIHSDTST